MPAPASLDSLFFVLGPTASGKTALAAQIATHCDAEILGADAFQVYRGLDILTAKPSAEILASVRHHLVGEVPLSQAFDVVQYTAEAGQRIADARTRGKLLLVVGGTGLYVRALTHGLAELPPADPQLRAELEALELPELQERLRQSDPEGALRIDLKNPRRVIRALEIGILTGKPFSSFREQWERPAEGLRGVILEAERELLNERIDRRTEAMFAQGVVEEVRTVGELGPTAGQAIGVREIRALLAGETSQHQCAADIQQATRRYAKRQVTWFRRETGFERVEAATPAQLDALALRLGKRLRAG